jgi:hypothetical protein
MTGELDLGWLWIPIVIVAAGGFSASRRCYRLLKQGLTTHPATFETSAVIVRGIRAGILAIGFFCFAGGMAFAQPWLFIFGIVFVAEELFETGIMLFAMWLAKRNGRKKPDAGKPPAG